RANEQQPDRERDRGEREHDVRPAPALVHRRRGGYALVDAAHLARAVERRAALRAVLRLRAHRRAARRARAIRADELVARDARLLIRRRVVALVRVLRRAALGAVALSLRE